MCPNVASQLHREPVNSIGEFQLEDKLVADSFFLFSIKHSSLSECVDRMCEILSARSKNGHDFIQHCAISAFTYRKRTLRLRRLVIGNVESGN